MGDLGVDKNAICCKEEGGTQKTPSASNGDQGVDKKRHLLQRGVRGWTKTPSAAMGDQGVDKKRHLLQRGIMGWTKNAICCKDG